MVTFDMLAGVGIGLMVILLLGALALLWLLGPLLFGLAIMIFRFAAGIAMMPLKFLGKKQKGMSNLKKRFN